MNTGSCHVMLAEQEVNHHFTLPLDNQMFTSMLCSVARVEYVHNTPNHPQV